ncbi:PQQ-binding-like beta-propeller repeat protein [Actinoplanes sp. TBRC 11911]|uniref:outer membrane protein assembly factor BamB family protein n=1 Tax=Actinoplanes sp. TBRC 11911 TaxID=2729386 RepID=UPI00145F585A|nr:PQQ-binding-like beta-propeller repeat protein [Actinoplanes sp. TBRC 11911]NMO54189.1 PQQ-binding-like beta-propeller repeat protein [Actinoplanes sp. TBRC 11911]
MSLESGVVVIELGLERGEPDSYRNSSRRTTPRWVPSMLVAALLLVILGASDPPAKSPLSQVFRLQVAPGDAYTLTSDGTLVAQTLGQLTSYDLANGQILWQSAQAAPTYRLRQVEGLVLMRPFQSGGRDPGTSAVALSNGASRWEHDGNVLTVPGSPTLLAVQPVRSYAGANRRVEGAIEALDPFSGDTRWTVQVPGTGVLLGVPGPADTGSRMLLVNSDRTMDLHDLDDGQLLASESIPAADYGPGNPSVAGGVILLWHPGVSGMQISAYGPLSLRPLWTRPAYRADVIKECGLLACLVGDDGVRAIDPVTGDPRWYRPQWKDIDVQGTMTIAYAEEADQKPVAVVDPDTAEVKVDLAGWRPVAGTSAGDAFLVTRAVDAGARSMVAVVRPDDRQPRPLADLPAGTGDCESAPNRLACRNMYGELVVWAYREG